MSCRREARSFYLDVPMPPSANASDCTTSRSDASRSGELGPNGLHDRAVIQSLQAMLVELEAVATLRREVLPLIRVLRRTLVRLGRPVSIAVLGEFNSGKSSVANSLMGGEALPTSVIACTHVPIRAYYADQTVITICQPGGSVSISVFETPEITDVVERIEIGLPVAKLREYEIWDLPGITNANVADTQALLDKCSPDIAIWCTAATQAWTKSEATIWSNLSLVPGTHQILAVTFSDLIGSPSERSAVLDRLQELTGSDFSEIVMASAEVFDERQSWSVAEHLRIAADVESFGLEAAVSHAALGVHRRRSAAALKTLAHVGKKLDRRLLRKS